MPQFIFVTCQIGAEKAVKGEVACHWPEFRLAFSRPGFLTFKLPADCALADDFDLKSAFARAYGFSLGNVTGENREQLADDVWQSCKGQTIQRIHVWEKDRSEPGVHRFEPGISAEAIEVHGTLFACCPHAQCLAKNGGNPLAPARVGDVVLDCVILSPQRVVDRLAPRQRDPLAVSWRHDVAGIAARRGVAGVAENGRGPALVAVADSARRRVAEIGSAPGGASQALLSRGYIVTGVDPAEMAPAVLNHPRFTHIRRRTMEVRRRDFQKIRWLTADMNVAPNTRSTPSRPS